LRVTATSGAPLSIAKRPLMRGNVPLMNDAAGHAAGDAMLRPQSHRTNFRGNVSCPLLGRRFNRAHKHNPCEQTHQRFIAGKSSVNPASSEMSPDGVSSVLLWQSAVLPQPMNGSFRDVQSGQ
jgi:hypothetical protein